MLITAVPGTEIISVPGTEITAVPGTEVTALPGTVLLASSVTAGEGGGGEQAPKKPAPEPPPNSPALLPDAPPKKSQEPVALGESAVSRDQGPSWLEDPMDAHRYRPASLTSQPSSHPYTRASNSVPPSGASIRSVPDYFPPADSGPFANSTLLGDFILADPFATIRLGTSDVWVRPEQMTFEMPVNSSGWWSQCLTAVESPPIDQATFPSSRRWTPVLHLADGTPVPYSDVLYGVTPFEQAQSAMGIDLTIDWWSAPHNTAVSQGATLSYLNSDGNWVANRSFGRFPFGSRLDDPSRVMLAYIGRALSSRGAFKWAAIINLRKNPVGTEPGVHYLPPQQRGIFERFFDRVRINCTIPGTTGITPAGSGSILNPFVPTLFSALPVVGHFGIDGEVAITPKTLFFQMADEGAPSFEGAIAALLRILQVPTPEARLRRFAGPPAWPDAGFSSLVGGGSLLLTADVAASTTLATLVADRIPAWSATRFDNRLQRALVQALALPLDNVWRDAVSGSQIVGSGPYQHLRRVILSSQWMAALLRAISVVYPSDKDESNLPASNAARQRVVADTIAALDVEGFVANRNMSLIADYLDGATTPGSAALSFSGITPFVAPWTQTATIDVGTDSKHPAIYLSPQFRRFSNHFFSDENGDTPAWTERPSWLVDQNYPVASDPTVDVRSRWLANARASLNVARFAVALGEVVRGLVELDDANINAGQLTVLTSTAGVSPPVSAASAESQMEYIVRAAIVGISQSIAADSVSDPFVLAGSSLGEFISLAVRQAITDSYLRWSAVAPSGDVFAAFPWFDTLEKRNLTTTVLGPAMTSQGPWPGNLQSQGERTFLQTSDFPAIPFDVPRLSYYSASVGILDPSSVVFPFLLASRGLAVTTNLGGASGPLIQWIEQCRTGASTLENIYASILSE